MCIVSDYIVTVHVSILYHGGGIVEEELSEDNDAQKTPACEKTNTDSYQIENKHHQLSNRIRLRVEHTNVYTRIYVEDEGVGIPENEFVNIFKRFYRVHNEVNPNSVGIGLSLAKSIVEGMGGRISVKSEEKKGTSFSLTFCK